LRPCPTLWRPRPSRTLGTCPSGPSAPACEDDGDAVRNCEYIRLQEHAADRAADEDPGAGRSSAWVRGVTLRKTLELQVVFAARMDGSLEPPSRAASDAAASKGHDAARRDHEDRPRRRLQGRRPRCDCLGDARERRRDGRDRLRGGVMVAAALRRRRAPTPPPRRRAEALGGVEAERRGREDEEAGGSHDAASVAAPGPGTSTASTGSGKLASKSRGFPRTSPLQTFLCSIADS
jgi:hypothetical protein